MKTGNRSNALLVELLIVVMFFMLASTVLLQVFSKAHSLSMQAERRTKALNEAQNVADRLYAADDLGAALMEMGFGAGDQTDEWVRGGEDILLRVILDTEAMETGVMRRETVKAFQGEELLVTLPVTRYVEVQP